jgi:predicted ABC-type ATPase
VPNRVVIAGPNGAGKSTAAPRLLERFGVREFVNADDIARGLSAFAPESVAVEAGRIMLERVRGLAAAGADFAFETTLASRGFARWIAGLRRAEGYRFHLVFLWLSASEQSIARVARRVAAGGHAIPDDVVRRRYHRGIANLVRLYSPIADTWEVYDNSSRMRLIARRNASGVEVHYDRELWASIVGESRAMEEERKYPAAADVNIFGVTAEEALAAARRGVSEALARHKALGQSIAVWRDGKVVIVPPEEIEIEN